MQQRLQMLKRDECCKFYQLEGQLNNKISTWHVEMNPSSMHSILSDAHVIFRMGVVYYKAVVLWVWCYSTILGYSSYNLRVSENISSFTQFLEKMRLLLPRPGRPPGPRPDCQYINGTKICLSQKPRASTAVTEWGLHLLRKTDYQHYCHKIITAV